MTGIPVVRERVCISLYLDRYLFKHQNEALPKEKTNEVLCAPES